MVQDSSEVGFNPDGSDDNGDWDVNTCTPLPPLPAIAISKEQWSCEDAGELEDANVIATFAYVIYNNGSAPLRTNSIRQRTFSANMNLGNALCENTYLIRVQVSYCAGQMDSRLAWHQHLI